MTGRRSPPGPTVNGDAVPGRGANGDAPLGAHALHVHRRFTVVVVAIAVGPMAAVALLLLATNDALDGGTVISLSAAVVVLGALLAVLLSLLVERWVVDPFRASLDDLQHSQRAFAASIERIGSLLGATHDRASIVDVLLVTAADTARAELAVFWEWKAGALRAAAAHGGGAPEGTLARDDGVAGAAAGHGQSVSAPPLEAASPEPATTALAVPLNAGGRLFGVLAVYGRAGGGPFSQDEAVTVHALAERAQAAIVNTFLHEEANRLSITDGLTGLWNRRQFDLSCASEIERAARFGEPFAVAILDIDRFKQVNDTHGHIAGDAILVELARRLTEATREVDVVARYGGEEFILLLPRTDRRGAVRVAEKLTEAVRSEPFDFDEGSIDLTVSMGVAAYPQDGTTTRELVKSADEALYRAKGAGRDRVVGAIDREAAEPHEEADQE